MLGWLRSRTGKKFRERQKTNTSQRRTERGHELMEAKRRQVGREGRRGIIPLSRVI